MKPREAAEARQLAYHAEVTYRLMVTNAGRSRLLRQLEKWAREHVPSFQVTRVVWSTSGSRSATIKVDARHAWRVKDWLDAHDATEVSREGVDCRPQWVKGG